MRYSEKYKFDRDIRGVRLGWSLIGPPVMTVYCYLFDDLMIDTGQAHMQKEVVSLARESGMRRIFLTHHHEDHSGNAAAVRDAVGSDIYGHHLTVEKLKKPFAILPYQKYIWGKTTPIEVTVFPEEIETSLGKLVPIHTPGHARDHTVYYLAERGIVFSGDLYLADRIKYFRSDEDMGIQIESLKKAVDLDFDMLLCAHNPKLKKGRQHVQTKLAYLENFYGDIIDLWKKGFPEKQIFKQLELKEAYFIKYFCFGNVSMLNGVRSAVRYYENNP